MDEIKLDVQIRERVGGGAVKAVRREDMLPAVVYGGGKHGPTNIKINRRAYEKIMRQHKGQSVVFHLDVFDGEKKLRDYSAIVKEEQLDPVHENVIHLDFLRISLTEEIEVKVPVELKGEAAGVKKDGGSLDQTLRELGVVCLPTNIPEKLEVIVDELNIGDSVHVKDIPLPQGVKTNHDEEAMVCSVVPPMKEEEPAEGDADAEPEVIGEKDKAEEAGEEQAEEKAEEKPEEKEEEKSE